MILLLSIMNKVYSNQPFLKKKTSEQKVVLAEAAKIHD